MSVMYIIIMYSGWRALDMSSDHVLDHITLLIGSGPVKYLYMHAHTMKLSKK